MKLEQNNAYSMESQTKENYVEKPSRKDREIKVSDSTMNTSKRKKSAPHEVQGPGKKDD